MAQTSSLAIASLPEMSSPLAMASPLLSSSRARSSSILIDPVLMEPIPLITLTEAEESVLAAQQKARDNMTHRYNK